MHSKQSKKSIYIFREAFLYGLVGVFNTMLDVLLFAVLIHSAVNPYIANVISFGCGAACSLYLNRMATFRSSAVEYSHGLVLRFSLVTVITLCASQFILYIFLQAGFSGLYGKLASVLVTFLVGFALNKTITFRNGSK